MMKANSLVTRFAASAAAVMLATGLVWAGNDSIDGPIVSAGKQALREGNVNLALIWVNKFDETEVRVAFTKALEVRKLSPTARELADNYFYQTLVRVHQLEKGESFSGLRPPNVDPRSAVAAADKAIEAGDIKPLRGLLSEEMGRGLQDRFQAVQAKRYFDKNDVKAGREYVREYGKYMSYVEGVHNAVKGPLGTEYRITSEPTASTAATPALATSH